MSARAVTAALKLHLPTVSPIFFRGRGRGPNPALQSSNCFLGWTIEPRAQFVGRDAEAEKSGARVCKSDWPGSFKPLGESFVTCVAERKCTSYYTLFENLQRSAEKVMDFSHKPNLFVGRRSNGNGQYFTALSLDEDGNLSPKYDIYPPLPPLSDLIFNNSCGGLFCYYDFDSRIFLWNPTTNEFKILPQSQSFVETPPTITNIMISSDIWFDHESEDFKVMRFFISHFEDEEGDSLGHKYEIELYSLKSDSWKKIPVPEFNSDEAYRVCIDGVYYCEAEGKGGSTRVILSFNFATESFSTLSLPDFSRFQSLCLLEYNGLLSILVYSPNEIEKSFELWVMMNGSWARESIFHTCGVKRPYRFWGNGELLFLESLNRELLLFDRATGKLKHLGVYGSPGSTTIIPFLESFVQLEGGSNLQEREKEEDGRMIDAKGASLMGA